MEFSANTCPLSIDNTVAPGTVLQCWNTGPYTHISISISGIDAAEYELVGEPGSQIIIASISSDGVIELDVAKYSQVCLRMVTSGIGTATINAYLVESTGDVVSFTDLCVPFFLSDGTPSNIPLIGLILPFFLSDGTPAPIPVVPC